MKSTIIFLLVSILIFSGCSEEYEEKGSAEYIQSINEWAKYREERLKQDDGWLNLVGLYWLEEGENTFGSDDSNDIVFPSKAAPEIGAFFLEDSVVTVKINENVDVLIDGAVAKQAVLKSDIEEGTIVMDYKSLRWYLIIREGGKFGIRLRDLDAPLVKNFEGIERFPVNDKWHIEANYIPLNPPKKLMIPNIIGTVSETEAFGRLDFEIDGEKFSLFPTGEQRLFIIFADQTSGVETYGAGRFLYTDGPDSNNIVILDFNKAYNPPCVFTKYATCPLPPEENYLEARITAGEKNYGEMH